MNHGNTSASQVAANFLSETIKVAAAATSASPTSAAAVHDAIVHEAFELHHLQTQPNSSLLEFGLNLGFIERRPADGRLIIDSLNAFPISSGRLVEQLLTELVLRLGVFIPATSFIKTAINNSNDQDREDALRCVYILSALLHQVVNYDETSMRTLNRVLVCVAIILFSLTTTNSKPCDDMKNFKLKIRRRLQIDYYMWCLMMATNLALTCSSPLYINLEYAHGIDMHMIQACLTFFCAASLCFSMRLIGYGRLAPLIAGTPLLFLDAGDGITLFKGATLFLSYFCFWCSDWRELVDWEHSMLCEAGVCKLLNKETGVLTARVRKAKHKFDEWRLEEGLDDDGWFILLDAPANMSNGATFRTHTNELSSDSLNTRSEPTDAATIGHGAESTTNEPTQQAENNIEDEQEQEGNLVDPEDEGDRLDGEEEQEEQDDDDHEQIIDYSERVIYLQSRNPLLTSLAAIMLVVWK